MLHLSYFVSKSSYKTQKKSNIMFYLFLPIKYYNIEMYCLHCYKNPGREKIIKISKSKVNITYKLESPKNIKP